VDDSPGRIPALDLEVLGDLDHLDEILARRPADVTFVALPADQHEDMRKVLNKLGTVSTDVQVVPDLLSHQLLNRDISQIEDIPVVTMACGPREGWNSLLKRTFDIVVSAAALVVLAVPMLLLAVLVKCTSRGPVFYRQVRAGLGGKPFRIIKFRTMRPDAEDVTGPVMATANDDRATRVGKVLRRTSLDELPQLLNVLLGQMSLVGPRPERPELIDRFRQEIPRYMLRHHVKAGLTGWAQIHGLRGRTSLRKRIQYDLYYVRHWTFGLDLWILLLTPFRGLIGPNAY